MTPDEAGPSAGALAEVRRHDHWTNELLDVHGDSP
jgi:hypothetical protein